MTTAHVATSDAASIDAAFKPVSRPVFHKAATVAEILGFSESPREQAAEEVEDKDKDEQEETEPTPLGEIAFQSIGEGTELHPALQGRKVTFDRRLSARPGCCRRAV
ncbi:MAG: hypothetical protein Q8L64_05965 [bacterium]|nr:hypothetical protein [bacterium]